MKRLMAAVVIGSLVWPSVVVAGERTATLREAADRVIGNSLQVQAAKPPRANDDLYWGGLVLSGVGGWMFGFGLGMGERSEQCVVTGRAPFTVVTCTESGGNRAMWLGLGGGLMATGIVMSAIGGKRVAVAPSLGGVSVLGTVSF